MYSGSNPSALRSREWIRTSLMQLLETQKYSQITIKDICKNADLSRQTFYQIFKSKDEVMQYHFSILFQEFAEECDPFRNIDISKISYNFFNFFYIHKEFIDILISNNLTYFLEQQFEIYLNKIDFFIIRNNDSYSDYTTAYVSGALTQILIHWFKKDFNLDIKILSKLTENIITGQVFKIEKK